MVIASILAGGKGARLGSEIPKQFIEINGEAVIIRCLRVFVCSGLTDMCILSVPAEYAGLCSDLVKASGLDKKTPVHIIPGGGSRGETLLKTLEFIKEKGLLSGSVLITHDAVRPFVTKRMIADNIEAAEKYGACNTCVPATDTVFISEDGRFISAVPDRKTVYHAQTPQSFMAEELYSLCTGIPKDVFETFTDGCSVYTYFGKQVFMARGERTNIKITYPEDIEKAKLIIEEAAGNNF